MGDHSTIRLVATGVAAGVAATFAKSKAEAVLQPLGERVFPPAPASKIALGADSAGHPENMPPSELVDRAQHAITGDELTDEQRTKLSPPIHWTMGVGFGTAYALTSARSPRVRAGRGTLAASVLFAATHGSTLPALGLQQTPIRMPKAWWVWEAGSHLIYGFVLDTAFGLLDRTLPGDRRSVRR